MTNPDETTQFKKGLLELAVLKLIAIKPLYGYDIITQLDKAGLPVVQGTLYPLLTRLRKDELVSYTWEESQKGPPRKYYEITDRGKLYLDTQIQEWQKIQTSMNILFQS